MPRDGLITNRYSRYLDTSILRYFDTLIRSMPILDLVVYDNGIVVYRTLSPIPLSSICDVLSRSVYLASRTKNIIVAVKSPPEQYCYEQYCYEQYCYRSVLSLYPMPPRSLFPSTPYDNSHLLLSFIKCPNMESNVTFFLLIYEFDYV